MGFRRNWNAEVQVRNNKFLNVFYKTPGLFSLRRPDSSDDKDFKFIFEGNYFENTGDQRSSIITDHKFNSTTSQNYLQKT
jgi:hypothetical protein